MRVLLIEDAPTNGDAVALALQEASYAVDRARDGDTGLLLFASQRYEMVLVDLDLPKRDGHAVLRRLRQRDARVPILAVAACGGPDDIGKGLDLGADDVVRKPVEFREMLAHPKAAWTLRAETAFQREPCTAGWHRVPEPQKQKPPQRRGFWCPPASGGIHAQAQTLNRKFITSPSCTTYSLPSERILPASLALASPPQAMKSA